MITPELPLMNIKHPKLLPTLPRFVTPYPDELLYSVIARQHLYSRYLAFKHTLSELFGENKQVKRIRVASLVDFPSRLDNLCERLPGKSYNSHVFISCHTLFPLFKPFLEPSRVDKLVSMMKGDIAYQSGYKMGIKHPLFFRFCRSCIEDDVKCYGEPFWHRNHQIFGVEICHIHGNWLEESEIMFIGQTDQKIFPLRIPSHSDVSIIPKSDVYREHYAYIAEGVSWLMSNTQSSLGKDKLIDFYLYYLNQLGYMDKSGKLRWSALALDIVEFYGSQFLDKLDFSIDVDKYHNSISWILSRGRKSFIHPVRHLLLMRFIGITPEKFFATKIENPDQLPFGIGPWFCINSTADHFNMKVITQCELIKGREVGLLRGIFSCACGFVYTRESIKGEVGLQEWTAKCQVISRGSVWEKNLKNLYLTEKRKVTDISSILNVSQKTVRKYVRDICKKGILSVHRNKVTFLQIQTKHRETILTLIYSNPNIGRTKLKRLGSSAYIWLKIHDKAWFEENLPLRRRVHHKRVVDWIKRDAEISRQVKDAEERMITQKGKPVRITLSLVRKKLSIHKNFVKHLDKLPKTMKVLNEILETNDAYQIRKLTWAIRFLNENGENLTRNKIKKVAGLSKMMPDATEWLEWKLSKL